MNASNRCTYRDHVITAHLIEHPGIPTPGPAGCTSPRRMATAPDVSRSPPMPPSWPRKTTPAAHPSPTAAGW